MMQLAHIALVQWHLFGREDISLSGDTAILGRNRSGKSTLIDLIQAVMTGGSANLFRFNSSAGDSGGRRSERSLHGYCLGQLSESAFLREQSVTHVALVFEDRAGNRPPVSVGLCIEATTAGDLQIAGRYVAPGIRIDTDMFVEDLGEGQQRSAAWSLVRERLDTACKGAGRTLFRSDTARNLIREYMRQLFTGRRHADPERFIRAFVMALSFEDRKSVEEFVRTYLLAKNDIAIGELRDSIQRYRDIQKDIAELQRRLDALQKLQGLAADFVELLAREEVARGTARLAELVEAGAALIANLRDARKAREQMVDIEAEIERYDSEIALLESEKDSLQAQLAAHDSESRRALLVREIRTLEHVRNDLVRRLQGRFLGVALAASVLDQRERLAPLKLGELFERLEALASATGGLQPPAWPRDPDAMERLIDAARDAARRNIGKLRDRRDTAITEAGKLRDEIAEVTERRTRAGQGQVTLDPRTVALMSKLSEAGMKPRTLCEVAEIVENDWREAAEALLGRDREAIIVEPEDAARAVEILRGNRDSYRGCRIVNTRRLADQPRGAAAGSLASVFTSEDELALAFLRFRTGEVRLADTQADLMAGGRAIMRDGAYNSGIVVEVLRTNDLKIGRAAAPLMVAELGRRIDELKSWLKPHVDAAKFHEDIERKLEGLAADVAEDDRLDRLVVAIEQNDEERRDKQARHDRIAATIDPAIGEGLKNVAERLRNTTAEKEILIEQRGEQRQVELEIGRRLGGGEGQPGSRLCLKVRLQLFRGTVQGWHQWRAARAAFEGDRPRSPARIAADRNREADDAREAHAQRGLEIAEALSYYRASFDSTAPVVVQDRIVVEIKPWIDDNVRALEENELIGYQRQANEAAEQIGRLFRTSFIHELNDRFNELSGELELLSKALRARPLHGEIYKLTSQVKPEFAALHRLARDSQDDEGLFDALFGRAEARDAEHAAAIEEVERLLSGETIDFTAYQDYRNYFTFDLKMRDVVTGREMSYERRKGTASGAERQVPYYVIIGAALASIYHGARRQYVADDLGLGLAVFDEAFSKMDGPNQRTLLEFYDDIGLQTIIAAPSEKRSVVYENLDSVVDVFRHEDSATTESVRIKPYAREQMRAANPQHLSDADLAARLETLSSEAAE